MGPIKKVPLPLPAQGMFYQHIPVLKRL